MKFTYSDIVRNDFPDLVSCCVSIDGVSPSGNVSAWVAHYSDIAAERLLSATEGAFPEIQAWRRTFSQMGLKPTQYRCASEALLRRFRTAGLLPAIHPLVDLCNAISIAFAIPIAVFDREKISGDLEVRHAVGDEVYETFSGEIEHPEAGEVIFADSSGRAHARRWVNRQSGYSSVNQRTTQAFIVSEALHGEAGEDIPRLLTALTRTAAETWPTARIVPESTR